MLCSPSVCVCDVPVCLRKALSDWSQLLEAHIALIICIRTEDSTLNSLFVSLSWGWNSKEKRALIKGHEHRGRGREKKMRDWRCQKLNLYTPTEVRNGCAVFCYSRVDLLKYTNKASIWLKCTIYLFVWGIYWNESVIVHDTVTKCGLLLH